ncbi:MAG: mono/diheme cytochrome c family protein [Verrucomicrobiales bacterium]|jgi:mono/diheme cytochrome c family protein
MISVSRLLTFLILLRIVSTIALGDEGGKPAGETVRSIAQSTKERLADRTLYFRGRQIFARMCAPCHGETGRGNGPWATAMTNKPRNLRMGVFKFRTTPYGKLPTEEDLRRTIRSGVSGTAMPTFSKLSEMEIDGVVAYVQSLSPRWRDEKNYAVPLTLPESPNWLRNANAIDAEHEKHAAKALPLFTNLCSSCHGAEGKGDGPVAKKKASSMSGSSRSFQRTLLIHILKVVTVPRRFSDRSLQGSMARRWLALTDF